MGKPLILVAAALVAVGAIVRKRSSAKTADAALWHEATSGSGATGANGAGTRSTS